MAELVPSIPGELISSALNMEDPLQLVYAIATYVRIELDEAQNLLEIDSLEGKLRHLMALLGKELEVLELGRKIQTEAQSGMEKVQREYFLREQLKAIQRELGESDEQTVEVEEFRERIMAAGMPEEAQKEGLRELEPSVAAADGRGRIRRHPHLAGLADEPALVAAQRGQARHQQRARRAGRGSLWPEGYQGAHP